MASLAHPSGVPDIYAHRGRHLLSQFHEQNNHVPYHKLSEMKSILHNPAPTPNLPVCIIGAGAAALYTAMILESLGISYHIIDADTPERIGGRLFTYHFPNGGPYDYYVCRTYIPSAPCSYFCTGSWSHAVPRYNVHEAHLRLSQEQKPTSQADSLHHTNDRTIAEHILVLQQHSRQQPRLLHSWRPIQRLQLRR